METFFPTRMQINTADAIARSFCRGGVQARKQDAQRFLAAGLDFLQKGIDADADRAFLLDTATGLHDALSNLVGHMRRDLDNNGIDPDRAAIDRSELEAIIAKLRPRRAAELKEPSL